MFVALVSLVTLGLVRSASAEEAKAPLLTIGSKAPSVDVEHWVSDNDGAFEHTTTLESGKVYVIEFWATWCGPCIRSMPHLAETQAEYPDDVQVISVSDEDLDTVNEFLKRKVLGKDDQTYSELTKTYCLTTDPDKSVKEDYFLAAGRSGIPCAFIVGKTGLIEWIGHPVKMGSPLEKVVNDTWDRDTFAVEYQEQRDAEAAAAKKRREAREISQKLFKETSEFLEADEYQQAVDYISAKLEDEAYARNWAGLEQTRLYAMLKGNLDGTEEVFNQYLEDNADNNRRLKSLLSVVLRARSEGGVDAGVFKTSLESAEAIAAAAPKISSGLYLYARFLHADKNIEKAIEVQEAAVENAGSRSAGYQKFLDRLKEEQVSPAS